MTIPHQHTEQPASPPQTYNQASMRYGPGTHAAAGRYDELSMRHHLARSYASLKASGKYDPAKHGTGDTEPLTAAEHLELLATAEYLSRSYKPHGEVHHALRAGADWREVAAALGTDEDAAREHYRSWAQGQHDMWASTGVWEGEPPHRFGMNDADYAAAMARASNEAELGTARLDDSPGLRQLLAHQLGDAEAPEAGV
jgi:hypothetical protein